MTTPIEILQRLAALHGAGRTAPADLVNAAIRWVAAAAAPILAGEPADVALGLRPLPGRRSVSRVHRFAQRDAGLAAACDLAQGADETRAETVLGWWDQYREGRPVPAPVAAALRQVAESGVPVPTDARTVSRRTRAARARAVIPSADCGTVNLEAPPIAAHE